MYTLYLVGKGHEDSETGQVGGAAYGVTFVHLHQETAVPGPLATFPRAFPVHAEGLSSTGLPLQVEGTHHVLSWEGQRVGLHWGGKRGDIWLRSGSGDSYFK